ncbi:MAG: sugar ABC transporter substrate-binding protein [Anaerolineae bacterium]|nr:sugar ABC transporter substrate-binding protein [Anaerolineae bacterium]
MSRKTISLIVMLALVFLTLGNVIAQETTVVTWAFWGSPEELATHQSVADAFMEENPEIEIEIWHQPWSDYFTGLQTLWAAGDGEAIPDVMFLSPISNYAADGVLEPLDSYIEDSGFDREDFWPGLLDFAMLDGEVYGFPRDIGLEVLYYNKDIFDEVGLDYPDETWTWDTLLDAAEQLSVVEASGRVSRYALGMEGGKYQLWVGQNHGSALDDMASPTSCTLNSPEAVEAVEFFAGMMDNDLAMRNAALSQAGGDAAVFTSGQVAMIIQNASRIPTFNAADMNYDVAVVPIPEGGQRSASAAGAAWTMSSFSDDKDAAWTFLSWLALNPEGGQRLYTESGEILPALRSTANSDAFLGQEGSPENRMAFIIEGDNAKVGRAGLFPQWNEINGTLIGPQLQLIWAGEAGVQETLDSICADVDEFLAGMD